MSAENCLEYNAINNFYEVAGFMKTTNSYFSHHILNSFPRIEKCTNLGLRIAFNPKMPKAQANKTS